MILEDFYKSRDIRIYDKIAPTIRSGRIGLLVMEKTKTVLIKQATKSGWIECEVGGWQTCLTQLRRLGEEESRGEGR